MLEKIICLCIDAHKISGADVIEKMAVCLIRVENGKLKTKKKIQWIL